jgi:hypothetical protein
MSCHNYAIAQNFLFHVITGFHNVRTARTYDVNGAVITVRYHSGGSMKLNARILLLAHMVYL